MTENNDDLKDLFSDSEDTQETQSDGSQDVKPVKLSRGATVAILLAGVFIVMLIFITIRGCSVEKKVKSASVKGTTITASELVTESSQNSVENKYDFTEKATIFEEVVTTPTELKETSNLNSNVTEGNTVSRDVETVSENTMSDGGISEVATPSLSEELKTKGIIVSKHTYKYQDCYVYGISISMLIGDNVENVQYFCPKKTFDAIATTEAVSVVYQLDTGGNISINSISK